MLAVREQAYTPPRVAEVSQTDLVRLDTHVHKLGEEAATAVDLRARAEAYARLLATCGTCHKLTKRGPQPEGEVEVLPP